MQIESHMRANARRARHAGRKAQLARKHGPHPIDVHVGLRIKQRRVELNVSQTKLGDSLDVSFQQIQKYERGTNRVSASSLALIAETLDVPISYFFKGAPGLKEKS